jgi:hypothetical protein
LWTVCLGWFWIMILLISASWVARITGVSHWYPAYYSVFDVFSCLISITLVKLSGMHPFYCTCLVIENILLAGHVCCFSLFLSL